MQGSEACPAHAYTYQPGRRHARVDPIMALASRELKLVCMYMNVGDTAPTSAAVI